MKKGVRKEPTSERENQGFQGLALSGRAGEEQMKLGGLRDTGVGARSGRGM